MEHTRSQTREDKEREVMDMVRSILSWKIKPSMLTKGKAVQKSRDNVTAEIVEDNTTSQRWNWIFHWKYFSTCCNAWLTVMQSTLTLK